jgi:CheY-like chemotaxis protein
LPDVVILDLLMPEMDGFQVLRSIKENQDLKNAKVIVLSNVGKKTDIEKAINLGAATYFTKSSLPLDELDRHIKDLLAETES